MIEMQKELQHFIMTRFNLLLWQKDKEGSKVRSQEWLEHRFSLFEKYCLPSVKSQTCQDFGWIVLFDSSTPGLFKVKIIEYQRTCPQLIPVFVKTEDGRHYAKIFREEMMKRLSAKRVVTTYLDNDDALNVRFAEDLRRRVSSLENGTFIYYDKGYQFYSDHKYLMQIYYPRNHFVSYVESGEPANVKGVFGFGGHYYIYTIKGARIEHVNNLPMWCEVVHEKNMLNDAYFLWKAKMVNDCERLNRDFSIDEVINYGFGVYLSKFLPRYFRTFIRRTKKYFRTHFRVRQ